MDNDTPLIAYSCDYRSNLSAEKENLEASMIYDRKVTARVTKCN